MKLKKPSSEQLEKMMAIDKIDKLQKKEKEIKKGPRFGFCKTWDPDTPRISVIFSGETTKGWAVFDSPMKAKEAFEHIFSIEIKKTIHQKLIERKESSNIGKEIDEILLNI